VQSKAFHEHVPEEILHERVAQRRGRRNQRGVKRKMSNWPLRKRHAKPLASAFFNASIHIIE
jgi:hypothetical protein